MKCALKYMKLPVAEITLTLDVEEFLVLLSGFGCSNYSERHEMIEERFNVRFERSPKEHSDFYAEMIRVSKTLNL